MQETNYLDRLDEKISQIVQKVESLKGENEALRTEMIGIKSKCEVKDQEIERLNALNAQKDQEIEEIVNKIENILG